LVLDLTITFEKKPTKSLEHLIRKVLVLDLATTFEKEPPKSLNLPTTSENKLATSNDEKKILL